MVHKDSRKIRISGKVLTDKELIKSLEQIQKEKREKSEMKEKGCIMFNLKRQHPQTANPSSKCSYLSNVYSFYRYTTKTIYCFASTTSTFPQSRKRKTITNGKKQEKRD